jgi:signal transduction histidine kinase
VAHDFNNLLMVVLGNLELVKKHSPDDPRMQRWLDAAIQSAQRGSALTKRMLAFARRQELRPEIVNVAEVVDSMTELLRSSLGPTIRLVTVWPDAETNLVRRQEAAGSCLENGQANDGK